MEVTTILLLSAKISGTDLTTIILRRSKTRSTSKNLKPTFSSMKKKNDSCLLIYNMKFNQDFVRLSSFRACTLQLSENSLNFIINS